MATVKKVMKSGGSTPAWTRSEGKDPKGGLNRKGALPITLTAPTNTLDSNGPVMAAM